MKRLLLSKGEERGSNRLSADRCVVKINLGRQPNKNRIERTLHGEPPARLMLGAGPSVLGWFRSDN
jgi:hypothetical protein